MCTLPRNPRKPSTGKKLQLIMNNIMIIPFVICVCRRIVFCLDVHNEAVKSMRYPPDAYKKQVANKDKDKPGEDEKTIEELIKELEDEMDEM
jgi:hypothetical protein